jgi:hypothetical protein
VESNYILALFQKKGNFFFKEYKMNIIFNFDNKTITSGNNIPVSFDEYWSPVQQPENAKDLWNGFIDDLNEADTEMDIIIIVIENGKTIKYKNNEVFNPRGAGRKPGSKNQKGFYEKSIAVRLPENLFTWCNRFGNASLYLRTLIEFDYEKKNNKTF